MAKFFAQLKQMSWWGRISIILFFMSLIVVLHPRARKSLNRLFSPPAREILATAEGDLFGNRQIHTVVKVRTPERIVIEVYDALEDHARKLIDTIELADRRDAHYHLLGQAVSLALKDMDGDRLPEIVAPTYDDQLTPHLNVFKFNKENQRFEPYHGADH